MRASAIALPPKIAWRGHRLDEQNVAAVRSESSKLIVNGFLVATVGAQKLGCRREPRIYRKHSG